MSIVTRCCKPQSRELQRLESAFNKLDVENVGAVPLRLLRFTINQVDVGEELDHEQKIALLTKADENMDGWIDFNEFVKIMQQPPSSSGSVLERVIFRTADLVTPTNQRRQTYSYLKAYSCLPPPVFMLCITIIQLFIFIYYAITAGLAPGWLQGCPGCTVNGLVGPLIFHPGLKRQVWRYLSYMLIHAGIEHLLGNVILQLILGVPLELVHKCWRVGPLYIAGIMMGSLLQSAADPQVSLVGASGGCYALLTAHLANVILNWREMPWRWVRLFSVTLFILADVSFAIYRRFYVGECDRVSYMAHVGGAIAGLLLGIAILRNIRILKWEKALSLVCLVLFLAFFLTCIVLNFAINPGHPAILSTRCHKNN